MKIFKKYTINDTLKQWTYNKILSNPELYGGDNGNNAIILAYLQDTNPFGLVVSLTNDAIAHSVAVSRCKNKLLELHPELDFRVKNKPKSKRQNKEEAQAEQQAS